MTPKVMMTARVTYTAVLVVMLRSIVSRNRCREIPCRAIEAMAGVRLISPFVGRILDWHKKASGRTDIPAVEDPGVLSVSRIYNYYKTYGYETEVMGASFRTAGEIKALSGCDLLTIGPKFLEELKADESELPRALSPELSAEQCSDPKHVLTESEFRFALNEDPMATELLAAGIRSFCADIIKLETSILERLES